MLQRAREWLVLLLIGALPFHALFVTAGTKLLAGPAHAPLPWPALWKEGGLALILIFALLELLQKKFQKLDRIDICILVLLMLSLAVSAGTHGDWKLYAFGFKYDFAALVAFLILRRASWSQKFECAVLQVLFVVGALVATYGIATLFFPLSLFTTLGYSDLHSLYLPDSPLPPFHQIGGTFIRRIQATFAGPNQLGLWILLPWSIALVSHMQTGVTRYQSFVIRAVIALLTVALLFTLSRAAWIAAAVILFAVLSTYSLVMKNRFLVYSFLGLFVAGAIGFAMFPEIFLRASSSTAHFSRSLEAVRIVMEHPLGLGLGSAGPASNRVSDACVYLEAGSDISWAQARTNLCVFVGETQAQPTDRVCRCPFLPENWYLQFGVELGVIGFILFVVLTFFILRASFLIAASSPFRQVAALVFFGISLAALFLHAWEDSAVAYTVWMLVAAALPPASGVCSRNEESRCDCCS